MCIRDRKKSFFIASICAAALRGEPKERDGLIGHLGERKVVYIDTEMGDFHVSKQKERINLMASLNIKENTDRFEFFAFHKCESNAQRMALIELAIKTVDNIGLLIIDGIADVSTKGINDEEEATMISSKLLKWTADYSTTFTRWEPLEISASSVGKLKRRKASSLRASAPRLYAVSPKKEMA